MPKRLHDTEIWRGLWFRKLPKESKLLWMYLKDACNCAGIVEVDDFEQMSFLIGCKITQDHLNQLDKQLRSIDSRRVLILDFIDFQYGPLTEHHKMRNKIFSELAKFDLKYPIDTLSIVSDTVKDKDIDTSFNLLKDKKEDTVSGVAGISEPVENPVESSAPAIPFFKEIKQVLDHLNKKINSRHPYTKDTKGFIAGRLSEGYSVSELNSVTDKKFNQWATDEKMHTMIRPSTLFDPIHFPEYINEHSGPKPKPIKVEV